MNYPGLERCLWVAPEKAILHGEQQKNQQATNIKMRIFTDCHLI